MRRLRRLRVVASTRPSVDVSTLGAELVLTGQRLAGVDFRGKELDALHAVGSRLEACRFDDVTIGSANFGSGTKVSEYVDCSFDRARIDFGVAGYARFVRCSFLEARLTNWRCFAVEIVDCTFTGRIESSFFNGTVPWEDRRVTLRRRNEIAGNDFSGADLVDVGFRTGVDLTRQRLPGGPAHLYVADAKDAVRRAKKQLVDVAPDVRPLAERLLGTIASDVSDGQRQLFLQREVFSRTYSPDVVGIVFGALSEESR